MSAIFQGIPVEQLIDELLLKLLELLKLDDEDEELRLEELELLKLNELLLNDELRLEELNEEEQEELEEMYLDETSENDCPVPEPGEGEIELWLEEA